MTPKEKAIELYNKFRNENPVMSANIRAKKQALIAVNEIIKVLYDTNDTDEEYGYWTDVKQELIQL